MNKCPKCGSLSIAGPKYEHASCDGWFKHSGELLRYICLRCGYSETTPTRDAAQAKGKASQ